MKKQRKIAIALLSLLVVVALAVWLWPNSDTQDTSKKTPASRNTPGNIQPQSQQSALSAIRNTGPAGGGGTSPIGSGGSSQSSAPSSNLAAPAGNFVSSYQTSSSDQEDSVCITTAGATCNIKFTNTNNSSNVVELGPKTANSDGAAEWVWEPSDIGLTAGNWKVTATATLNGQTKSTDVSQLLTIK